MIFDDVSSKFFTGWFSFCNFYASAIPALLVDVLFVAHPFVGQFGFTLFCPLLCRADKPFRYVVSRPRRRIRRDKKSEGLSRVLPSLFIFTLSPISSKLYQDKNSNVSSELLSTGSCCCNLVQIFDLACGPMYSSIALFPFVHLPSLPCCTYVFYWAFFYTRSCVPMSFGNAVEVKEVGYALVPVASLPSDS